MQCTAVHRASRATMTTTAATAAYPVQRQPLPQGPSPWIWCGPGRVPRMVGDPRLTMSRTRGTRGEPARCGHIGKTTGKQDPTTSLLAPSPQLLCLDMLMSVTGPYISAGKTSKNIAGGLKMQTQARNTRCTHCQLPPVLPHLTAHHPPQAPSGTCRAPLAGLPPWQSAHQRSPGCPQHLTQSAAARGWTLRPPGQGKTPRVGLWWVLRGW